MFLIEFVFVFLLALVATMLFALTKDSRTPWPELVWLFMILMLATWGLGVWLRPIGPAIRGFHWGPFVAAIVVVILLLLAAISGPRPVHRKRREELKGVEIRPMTPVEEKLEQEQAERNVARCFGVVFWVLIAVAVAVLLVHYTFRGLA